VCHAGAGRVDAMAALSRCRSVDVAAAVLIAREAGAIVGLPEPGDVASAPLDLSARYHVVVGTDEATFGLARDALEASASEG
jgi:myo-inositol-1(or 4)-monophosphatase